MGNTESNVTSGVKKQTDTSSILLYKLVDLKGEREIIKNVQITNHSLFDSHVSIVQIK